MKDRQDRVPDVWGGKTETQIAHEDLLKKIRITREKGRIPEGQDGNSDWPVSDVTLSAEFLLLEFEIELDEFYEKHPGLDPRNQRWSNEFCEIGCDPHIKPRFDWLKKSTWTIIEAINLVEGYRPERPKSLLQGSQKMILEFLDVDMFVKIHPVNPSEEPEKFRFKPQEFVTWLSSTIPGSVPDPIISLSTLEEDRENFIEGRDEGSAPLNKHVEWRETRRDEHRKAIRYVIERWQEECVGRRGKMTGDAVSEALDNHWSEVKKNIKFTYDQLGARKVADLARVILKDEITE